MTILGVHNKRQDWQHAHHTLADVTRPETELHRTSRPSALATIHDMRSRGPKPEVAHEPSRVLRVLRLS